MGRSIVDIKNMGDALRNTGYKDIESAVAEIVDNSVEAEAKNIFLIISESVNAKSGRKNVTEIAFLDNGIGMSEDTLAGCLGIGSTTRSVRKGMGRFGVGLPQASLYACPEIEVYSWQDGIANCKKVFLDINKIKEGTQTEIEDPKLSKIPLIYEQYINYKTENEIYDFNRNGTLVIWKNCDRLQPKTRGPLINRLEPSLGQKFRYFISEDKCNIKIISSDNPEGIMNIYPNDPLFLMKNNYVLGNPEKPEKLYKPNNSFRKECPDKLEPFFEPFANDIVKDGTVIKKVKYYDKNGDIAESNVIIRFSIVKNKFYDQTAFTSGKNPGNYEVGKYAKKLEGISVVRANREIDFRTFDFYDNINQPQHRWWGCEIIFTPELDESFGVANNKQYVELKEVKRDDLDPDEEIEPIWMQLNNVIEPTIRTMYNKNEETRKNTRTVTGISTSPTSEIVKSVEKDNLNTSESREIKKETDEKDLIEKGKEILKNQGFEEISDNEVKTFLENDINIIYKNVGRLGPIFDYNFSLGGAIVTINTEHEFYTSFLKKVYEDPESKVAFELFIAALVKSIDDTENIQRDQNDNLIATWNEKLRKYIKKQLNPSTN